MSQQDRVGAESSVEMELVHIGRHVEVNEIGPKASRPDSAIDQAGRQPNAAGNFGGPAQVQPNEEADEKTEQWKGGIRPASCVRGAEIASEGARVNAHEGNERAEV